MIKAGQIYDEIADILDAANDPVMQDRIWRRMNYEYVELCREVSWAPLRSEPVTLDFSGADSTGMWLPSDLMGIDLVWDATNNVEFFAKDRPAAQLTDEYGYRYWLSYPSRSDLFSGTDLLLSKGGASFSSASLTAAGTAVDGEYVQFSEEPGLYEITSDTSPFTFEPTYYGPQQSHATFSIRPWQVTQKMVIIDPEEMKLLDRTVYVYYWRLPTPLYRKSDVIQMQSSEILKLRTLRGIPESKGRFGISESMLSQAFRRAVKSNPKFPRSTFPRDKHFQNFTMNKNPFQPR